MKETVTYFSPAWGLVPPKGKKFSAVHVQVKFEDDSTLPVEIAHNMGLPYGAPLQEPEWIVPTVIVNPIAGGANAPLHVLGIKDGDTLTLGRVAGGPGTAVTYDVWIYHQKVASFWS
jgi:hypothetical protein